MTYQLKETLEQQSLKTVAFRNDLSTEGDTKSAKFEDSSISQ